MNENSLLDFEEEPYCAIPSALRIIPRTLLQNAGGNVIRSMNELEKLHDAGMCTEFANVYRSFKIWFLK